MPLVSIYFTQNLEHTKELASTMISNFNQLKGSFPPTLIDQNPDLSKQSS